MSGTTAGQPAKTEALTPVTLPGDDPQFEPHCKQESQNLNL